MDKLKNIARVVNKETLKDMTGSRMTAFESTITKATKCDHCGEILLQAKHRETLIILKKDVFCCGSDLCLDALN